LSKSAATNAVPGNLQINPGGFATVANAEQIPDTASVNIGPSTSLQLAAPETIGPLSLAGASIFNLGGGRLILNGDVTATGGGSSINVAVDLGGAVRRFTVGDAGNPMTVLRAFDVGGTAAGLTKDGPGFLELDGPGNFTGATTVNGGTLV